jgi:hypothetical protein
LRTITGGGHYRDDGCKLVTAQQLSQATGVQYTAIQDSGIGSICNVTGASPGL